MKKAFLFPLIFLLLSILSSCEKGDAVFSVGEMHVFCPAAHTPDEGEYLYTNDVISETVVTTDTGTYAVFTNGINISSPTNVTYRIMRLTESGWEAVVEDGKTLRMNTLQICSNQKGKLAVVSLWNKGIGFGLYNETTGEFSETILNRGSHYFNYVCGIDPNAGKEGVVYAIVSHRIWDKDTKLIAFDIATQTVSEQVFSQTPYSEASGTLLFNEGVGHVFIQNGDGTLCYLTLQNAGTPDQTVSAPLEITDPNVDPASLILESVSMDKGGKLYVFYSSFNDDSQTTHCSLINKGTVENTIHLPGSPFAVRSFTDPNGRVYYVYMTPGTTEGLVCSIENESIKEKLSFHLDDAPNLMFYHSISTSNQGGIPDNGTWLVYPCDDRINFVTVRLDIR